MLAILTPWHTRLTARHSAVTRITHWGITASFALLFGTGAAIYNRRHSFRIGPHVVRLPRIPSWLSISASPQLIHYVSAFIFVLCGIWYVTWGLRGGHFKELLLKRADVAKLVPMQLYYLRLRKEPPAYGRYNPLQKLAYSLVLFVIAPLIVLSGMAMLPLPILQPLGALFVGGVKLWHFGLMSSLCLFVVGHTVMVASTGFVQNMQAMISGPQNAPDDAMPDVLRTPNLTGRPVGSDDLPYIVQTDSDPQIQEPIFGRTHTPFESNIRLQKWMQTAPNTAWASISSAMRAVQQSATQASFPHA